MRKASVHKESSREVPLTYISLFSSAGVGCFGFKLEGFECVATNELIERRLEVQKANNKCRYETGYVLGDVSQSDVKKKIFEEIHRWKNLEKLGEVDVVIATPPCQGMSVANHKHSDTEIRRNSLIVESLKLVAEIKPKVFVFENVPRFMSTLCTDIDGEERPIGAAIDRNLGRFYSIYSKVINFKEYGSSSSRSRTLVIGVRQDLADFVSPIELFPKKVAEITLRSAIGRMRPLKNMGEIDPDDIFHSFRSYPKHMEAWIANLSQGQSAFDNTDDNLKPHQVVNGTVVLNQNKNGDKYRRQIWDKVGPCVHTRNDQLASQNTIHPRDNRVFSIRELMKMMTVPKSFKWVSQPEADLNTLDPKAKTAFLKKHEMNIRQSLGEAVPTSIFQTIAVLYKREFSKRQLSDREVRLEIESHSLDKLENLVSYLNLNSKELGMSSLFRIVELSNSLRQQREAFFTNKRLVTEILKTLPDFKSAEINILEPSVGAGNFLPLLIKILDGKKINLTLFDVDQFAIESLTALFRHMDLHENIDIKLVCDDYLLNSSPTKYDLIIGNPPFSKSVDKELLRTYRDNSASAAAQNTAFFFLEKAIKEAKFLAFVMPKNLLSTPDYDVLREQLSSKRIQTIVDFGENGFSGVLIETISISVNTTAKPNTTEIVNFGTGIRDFRPQSYICDNKFPTWLIYRNELFDSIANKLEFGVFSVFRDRQITTKLLTNAGEIRVLKSRNLAEDGSGIVDIPGYDSFISLENASKLAIFSFLEDDSVYLAPNMTYKPRIIKKPKGTLANGSAAILKLKPGKKSLTDKQLLFIASDEFREFYRIARNKQTRSLNIDANSVFFFGKLRTRRN